MMRPEPPAAADGSVLSISGLRFRYGRSIVLADINLTVVRGEWLALLGPNASGKTTLLQCIAGLRVPEAGSVHVCGYSLRAAPRSAKSHLGFVCAPQRLPGLLTGRQCLEVHAAAKGLASIGSEVLEVAEQFQFTRLLDGFVDTYSLGTQQKLAVLLGLLGEPELLILDEAFNGLDPASTLVLKQHLRARASAGRCAVVLATHALDLVEHYADRAALLLDGRIAHHWRREELTAMREQSAAGFEATLAASAARTSQ